MKRKKNEVKERKRFIRMNNDRLRLLLFVHFNFFAQSGCGIKQIVVKFPCKWYEESEQIIKMLNANKKLSVEQIYGHRSCSVRIILPELTRSRTPNGFYWNGLRCLLVLLMLMLTLVLRLGVLGGATASHSTQISFKEKKCRERHTTPAAEEKSELEWKVPQ